MTLASWLSFKGAAGDPSAPFGDPSPPFCTLLHPFPQRSPFSRALPPFVHPFPSLDTLPLRSGTFSLRYFYLRLPELSFNTKHSELSFNTKHSSSGRFESFAQRSPGQATSRQHDATEHFRTSRQHHATEHLSTSTHHYAPSTHHYAPSTFHLCFYRAPGAAG